MRDTQVPVLCRELCSDYFKPSQLKQILRSNVKPVRRGSVINYSANQGLPRRTRSSKSSDASNTPQTQRNLLQETVNTIHFQATDSCLFKYQPPAQMLWKTENNTFFSHYILTWVWREVKRPEFLFREYFFLTCGHCVTNQTNLSSWWETRHCSSSSSSFSSSSFILCGCRISTGLWSEAVRLLKLLWHSSFSQNKCRRYLQRTK